MESSPFIEVTILVRQHQVSDLYKFASQLANNADMAFPPLERDPSHSSAPVTKVTQVHATPDGGTVTEAEVIPTTAKEPVHTVTIKQPDGPAETIPGTVDSSKFSGCRNVNEVVSILWKENGIRTVADARKAFDEIRASGLCACASVVPEDGIDTRIERAIGMLQAE